MSASSQPVKEFPHFPSGTVYLLETLWNIDIFEYSMLWACDRHAGNPIGLRYDQATALQRKLLRGLQQKRYVELNVSTGCYELTISGVAVVISTPSLSQGLRISHENGKVLQFPSMKKEAQKVALGH